MQSLVVRGVFFLVTLALCGCRNHSGSLDDRFREITTLLRHEKYDLALAKTDEGLRPAIRSGDLKSRWRFQLLRVEILLGRRLASQALAALDQYGEPPNGGEWIETRGRALLLRGQAYYTLNRFADAQNSLFRAAGIAKEAHLPSLAAEVELRRGTLLAIEARFDEAGAALQNALAASTGLQDSYLEARTASNMGFLLHSQSRYDEAIPWFERSKALSTQFGAMESVARANGNLGACYTRLGDSENAKLYYRRAEEAFAKSGNRFEQQIWLGNSGNVSLNESDYAAAAASYAGAARIAREVGASVWLARWLSNLASASIELGDWDAAEKYNDEARSLKRNIEDAQYKANSLTNAARIAAGRKRFEQAETLFREALKSQSEDPSVALEAHADLADLFAREGHPSMAEAEFQTTIAEIDRRGSTLLKDEYRLSWLDNLIRFYRMYVNFLIAEKQPLRALEIAESSRSHVLAGSGGKSGSFEATRQQYQSIARRSNATLLEFWLGTNQSYLWVITPERIEFHTLPAKGALHSLISSYNAVITAGRDPLDVANETGRKLYEALIAPAIADTPGKTRFIIVPDDDLYSFNFESLPGSGRTGFWIEQATVAIAPSLNYLVAGARGAARNGDAKLLLVGDPVPSIPQYPRLEYAGREIDSIAATARNGSATILKGADARPDRYAGIQPGRFDFIHFAAHASANRISPLDSAVILSGSPDKCRLLARDVVAVPLSARLVTVSACRSAGGKAYAGEGLVGFAWAFLKAGAGNVIAGLWDVNDRSTTELMSRLYAEIASGSPIPDALRTSKLALIHRGGAWAKPFYWAPFQLYTGTGGR